MAFITASPPTMSPPLNPSTTSAPSLPPLITSNPTPRRTSSNRPTSWAVRRISNYSAASKTSRQHDSRPASHVFPAFHSSLPYTLVRDFAYPLTHPMHYGPPPPSEVSTPASENRRLSDPGEASWEDSRSYWSATPSWMSEIQQPTSRDQLPATTFSDGGPPYSEDEDLHSPIVTTSRKKHRSQASHERGRSPAIAPPVRRTELDPRNPSYRNGPGTAIENYPRRFPQEPQHRDSNFAKPITRTRSPFDPQDGVSEDDFSEDDEARYSKDYSFTIASPDEEMHGKAVALFDFESEHPNELALKEGQIILVSYRHGQGWLVAEDPRTKESGLVPEEFVRLARDIEGGLTAVVLEDNGDTALSPISNEPASATTPTPGQQEFPHHALKLSGEKHPPVQSTFSTSREDFLPTKGDEGGGASPTDVQEDRDETS